MKIVHWTIKYTTADEEVHYINDIPDWVANTIDEFLDLEEERINNE
tara:strand:+ start:12000 stop:12137 length:138 start_codon:yes stop_codon:yes gene_type:complete